MLYRIVANKSIEARAWYAHAAELLGFDLYDYCSEYEDSLVPVKVLEPVLDALVILPTHVTSPIPFEAWDIGNGHYNLSPKTYRAIWLDMMHYGARALGVEIYDIEAQTGLNINIGGYGLYHG